MKSDRLLECLAADEARLREAGAAALGAPVPSCPGWTGAELVDHVAMVYLHKAEVMRRGAFPEEWEPRPTEDPIHKLDQGYADLRAEFASRDPAEAARTWFPGDQTVAFWIRRMAQETVIHRVDAELAAGLPLAPIPDDLAVDGIDEVLVRFLEHGSREWAEDFGDALATLDGRAVRVAVPGASWLVRLAPEGVTVVPGDGAAAAATISGDPVPVLLWLWRRGGDEALTVEGDRALVGVFHDLMAKPTL